MDHHSLILGIIGAAFLVAGAYALADYRRYKRSRNSAPPAKPYPQSRSIDSLPWPAAPSTLQLADSSTPTTTLPSDQPADEQLQHPRASEQV